MDRSSRRVIDDDRLTGLWLRHASSDEVFSAPGRLPDATFGIVQAELRTAPGAPATRASAARPGRPSRRTIHWQLFDRSGRRDAGELDRPAVAFWQALAHVERLLRERGIRLDAGDQAKA